MRIVVTRPEEDAVPLRRKLESLNHTVITVPLLAIVPRPDVTIPPRSYQAIAITSANGIRSLAGQPQLKSVRILTVGPQSLAAARAAGFETAEAHGGDVTGLAAFVAASLSPADGPILYLSGAETTGGLEARLTEAGFGCDRVIIYDACPAQTLGAAAEALRRGAVDAVLLYSPRSAKIWCELIEREGLAPEAALPRYVCLSRNVAAALPQSWRRHVAARPDEAAMLALLEQPDGTG